MSSESVIPETLRTIRTTMSLDGPSVSFKATAQNIDIEAFASGSAFGPQFLFDVRKASERASEFCFLFLLLFFLFFLLGVCFNAL